MRNRQQRGVERARNVLKRIATLKTQPYAEVVTADDFRVVMPFRSPKVVILITILCH